MHLATSTALLAGIGIGLAVAAQTTLKMSIPDTPVHDEFYTVDVDFQGQTLPLMVDTGSADILVASNQCNNVSAKSGCYHSKLFQITKSTNIINGQNFSSVVGAGGVNGNQSVMDVGFGPLTVTNLAVPLIYSAATDEFQRVSFSGILGMGLLSVSREYYYHKQLPPFNKMAAGSLLAKPVFSITVPRYGDPASPKYGNLTLGGIEANPRAKKITYSNAVAVRDYNPDEPKYAFQTWTQVWQGFRVNGKNVPLPKKGLGQQGQFIATLDSGGENLFVGGVFNKAANLFKGKTDMIPDVNVYFDCSEPQLLEFKFNGQWIPIDPLDMIIPGATKTVNGTLMCLSSMQAGNSAFSDALLAPQFFRNTLTVFEYNSTNFTTAQPRVGVAPLTNANAAVQRYQSVYKNRLK